MSALKEPKLKKAREGKFHSYAHGGRNQTCQISGESVQRFLSPMGWKWSSFIDLQRTQ